MKKLIMATAMLATMAVAAFAAAHPRTYVLDVGEVAPTVSLAFNSYGPNYQATPDFSKFMKGDKPQKGDTLEVHMKFKPSIDLPVLLAQPVDSSAQANYWTTLADSVVVGEDLKAGQTYDFVHKFVLTEAMKGSLVVCLQYDTADQTQKKINKASKLTVTKTVTTTDTSKEIVKRTTPKTWNVNLTKYAAFLEIKTNHPWVNGVQDMSKVSNYEATAEISKAFDNGKSLPIKGDTVIITYKATSNMDIDTLMIDVIENTAAVNWWAVLSTEGPQVFAENIKKGTPFEAKATFKLKADPQEGISLQIFYDVDKGKGPAIFKLAK